MLQADHPPVPAGFHLLIAAQFASALADNALLIVTVALLMEQGLPGWWAPMLKFGFTIFYVVLAPFVGALADAFPKARLMAAMNAVKLVGALGLCLGVHPMVCFAVVGLGAAAYAPAKYGLITELVAPGQLVRANGWIEVSVVGAALLGTVLGGLLVSPWLLEATATSWIAMAWAQVSGGAAGSAYLPSIVMVLTVYGAASCMNLWIPDSGARYPKGARDLPGLWAEFTAAQQALWSDRLGGVTLAVTTVFWGVGATLQFAVLHWAQQVLRLGLDRAAYLQAAVAVGVVAGAWAAGRWMALGAATRLLPLGTLLGLTMTLVSWVDSLPIAVLMLATVGAAGGLLVVPMNALLQHRGLMLLSAGRSIAVQGFNENAGVLVMLAVYGALTAWQVPVVDLLFGYGMVTAAAMTALHLRERRRGPVPPD